MVENADVRGVFTTRGAVLKSWQLKKYRDDHGRPYELVAGHAPADSPLPLTLAVDDAGLSTTLATAPFSASESGSGASWQVQFDYDANGVRAQKRIAIESSKPYVLNVTVSVTRDGQALPATLKWGPALGSGITIKSRSYNPPPQPIYYKDGSVSRVAPAKINDAPIQEGTFGFAGVDDHYFLTSLVKPRQAIRVQYAPVDVALPENPEGAHYVSWSARFPTTPQTVAYFAGPKDFDVLVAVDRELVRAIDFGKFAWLVVPLLRALKWINVYVGNYGWSLILLTIAINLAMFPLRHKSVVSMRKMQDVQPEVKAIQDRYKNLKMSDPARAKMNNELMALYKERGVNPASGCVPMLLTLPVLFAFYSMLSVAIELRGAPFIGQIHDLSAHDPWFVWPVVMGDHDVHPAEDDAVDRRSGAAENHAGHADHDERDVPLRRERSRHLLDRQQHLGHRPADGDEPPDRAGTGADRAPAGRAAREERRRRQDRPGQGALVMTVQEKASSLVRNVVSAMGLTLDVQVTDTPDAIRIDISGDGGEVLLKRKGEALDALQQIVNTGFRRELTTIAASSWTAWAIAGAKTTSSGR